jgi:hypothetical protein
MKLQICCFTAFFLGSVLSTKAGAVTITQVDTFEDGTTQGWGVGAGPSPTPPVNVADGGPGGTGDNYLLLTATGGNGPGSKLGAFNTAQWAGDYIAAGITQIGMQVKNFGPQDVYLRLLFADPTGGPPSNIAFTTNAILAQAGADWNFVVFDVSSAALTAGLGSVEQALSNATELRIFHNPVAAFPPPPVGPPAVNAQLGIDDIRAVPEPSTFAFLTAGMLGLALRRRFATRRSE